MQELAERLAAILNEKGLMLTTAESCTGGMIASAITDLPGSSSFFVGGFVTYSNELKIKLLNVPPDVLEAYGAVSEQTAKAMAEGAMHASGADVAVSATGIAGPDGGTDEKPVGLVYTGYAINGSAPMSIRHDFSGNRQEIRSKTVEVVISNLINLLK